MKSQLIHKFPSKIRDWKRLAIQVNMSSSKEGMVNRKRSNDDDDFVRTPPPHISTVVQIQAEPFPCLNTRFHPEHFDALPLEKKMGMDTSEHFDRMQAG
ncbi:hypothetical protein LXL04_038694 [Taraxacum kok-saghyz]